MPHVLRNDNVEVYIDLPAENYRGSRFDWTGKIVDVKFKGKYLSSTEIVEGFEGQFYGRGLYNEFGIDSPLAFTEVKKGDFFHKIGIGLLQKDAANYDFQALYAALPAKFSTSLGTNTVHITCQCQAMHGYSYRLEKYISLIDSGFEINSLLKNQGEKPIVTNEYNHNFLSIDHQFIDHHYLLKFPFLIEPSHFRETINPDRIVAIREREITFLGTPTEPFYFSNLSGGKLVEASWALENVNSKIGISETGNFQTNHVNLWGSQHVISPELFFDIHIESHQSVEWTRTYHIYEI